MRKFFILLAAACLAACSSPSKEGTRIDAPEGIPERIVTLNGTLTEIISAIGLEGRIVGTDVTSKFPETVNALPKLGHDKAIRAEGILSLAPDLVMANKDQLDPAVEGQLRQAGIRLMLFTPVNTIEGTKELIVQVADSLGRRKMGIALGAEIDSEMGSLPPLPSAPKVLFIYARGAGTLLVAGEGTPIQSLISLAGGANAVSGFTDFKPLTPEALAAANPDVVLLFNTGKDDLQGDEALMRVPGMAGTAAGRNKAFIRLDPSVIAGFGPRVGKAITLLNSQLRALVKT